MGSKSKLISDRMKDFEDVASGKKPTRVVGQGKKSKPSSDSKKPSKPSKPGYKHGGEVMSKRRANRSC